MKLLGIWLRFGKYGLLIAMLALVLLAVGGNVISTAAAAPNSSETLAVQKEFAPSPATLLCTANPQNVSSWDVVRMLNSNAYLFEYPGKAHLLTVHAGRGFRQYQLQWYCGDVWAYGHSAEAPTTNGWILASHLNKPLN